MSFTGTGAPGAPDKRTIPQEPPGSDEQASAPPAVELREISKDFGSNRALDSVNLRIGHGEVVGLVGQNGSGKSTLVKVLSGVHAPEPGGRMFVSGEEVPLPLAPGQASEIGLSFVYQNLALAAGLSVLENLTLGQRIGGGAQAWAPINWLKERRSAAAVLDRYQVKLNLDRRTGEPIQCDRIRAGGEADVVQLPAAPFWRRGSFIERVSPHAFGLDAAPVLLEAGAVPVGPGAHAEGGTA